MSSRLFSPLKLRELELANRVVVSPMCQYSARDGCANDWHLMHLGQFAVSGSGLLFTEATAVSAEGRISPGCLGLYSEASEAALARVVKFAKAYGNVPVGLQLAHAGRKGSTLPPWEGGAPAERKRGGWTTLAPSALPYADGWPVPRALSPDGLAEIIGQWQYAAHRAQAIGADALEIHAAHGYLLHQFLSPISNQRKDGYGGSLENRMRFPLEVFDAVRRAWPREKPLGVRISATDWVDGGWDIGDTIAFAKALDGRGCDFIDVSSGGTSPAQEIAPGPGYQVEFAAAVKAAVGMAVMTVGMITEPMQAETIVRTGQADLVALGRGMLYDPRWTWRAAEKLRSKAAYPQQYARAHPTLQGAAIPGNPPSPDKS